MNVNQVKSISIIDYLHLIGIDPIKTYRDYSLFHSPFRDEKTPSFKVSHSKNLWVDYGDGNSGGTLIDLVLKIHPGCTVSEAIQKIEKVVSPSFFFHPPEARYQNHQHETSHDEGQKIKIRHINDLGMNPAITSYLKSRGVQIKTAMFYCKEIYYAIGDRHFFGLGNENHRGWSIRNKYWKGCTAQGYSLYKSGNQTIAVFEGIFDMLSYLELQHNQDLKQDFLVLNSLVNSSKSTSILLKYDRILLFLDQDLAGRKATNKLLQSLSNSRDGSSFYAQHNDLNEYHIHQKAKESNQGRSLPERNEASHVLVKPKRLLR